MKGKLAIILGIMLATSSVLASDLPKFNTKIYTSEGSKLKVELLNGASSLVTCTANGNCPTFGAATYQGVWTPILVEENSIPEMIYPENILINSGHADYIPGGRAVSKMHNPTLVVQIFGSSQKTACSNPVTVGSGLRACLNVHDAQP